MWRIAGVPHTVTRVFANGPGEWLRWLLAMAIGAGVIYGTFNTRLTAFEQQIESLAQDVRELRLELFRRGGGSRP